MYWVYEAHSCLNKDDMIRLKLDVFEFILDNSTNIAETISMRMPWKNI